MQICMDCILLKNGTKLFVKASRFDHIPDHELLGLYYEDKDQKWIGILLERYTLLLLGVCMKYLKDEQEARDCVQQIFLKVLTDLPKYKVTYFKSWLYMVAKNYCLMRLSDRHGKEPRELSEQVLEEPAESNDQLYETEWTYNMLEESLRELSPEQRDCVILFYLKKNSYAEVSEKTGYSMMQVKSFIQNGKRNLRNALDRKLSQRKEGHS
jgi:RNA polymerase sigma factor (sigma-70 family)